MGGFVGLIDFTNDLTLQDKTIDNMKNSLHSRTDLVYINYLSNSAVFMQGLITSFKGEHTNHPLFSTNKGDKLIINFNGRIYNKQEVKDILRNLGVYVASEIDSHIVLAAYSVLGSSCLNYLNGMFAFTVWHVNEKKLFLARDRAGAKPLFFSKFEKGLIFGSELKNILASGKVKRVVDSYGLKQILLLGPGRTMGKTPVKNVLELCAGECAFFDSDGLIKFKYWNIKATKNTLSVEENIKTTESLVTNAIKSQIKDTNNIACFLSGGLDSSIICKIVADEFKKANKTLATYSVDYQDNDKFFVKNSFQPDSDNKFIDLMSEHINSQHTNIVLDSLAVAKSIDEASIARDMPGMADIDSSLLLLAKAVKANFDIGLSGESADELFGGYPWYFDKEILFNETFPWSGDISIRKNLFNAEFIGSDAEDYVKNEYDSIINLTDYLETDSKLERRMREMFMLNYYSFMQTLVDRKDRMTMLGKLEVRMPFADHNIVEYTYNIPWDIKALNGREKGLLRTAFKNHLPTEITNRKKSPYPKTYNPILLNYVVDRAKKIVESNNITSTLINKKYFYQLVDSTNDMKTPWYGQLMRLPQIFGFIIQIDNFFTNLNLSIE